MCGCVPDCVIDIIGNAVANTVNVTIRVQRNVADFGAYADQFRDRFCFGVSL